MADNNFHLQIFLSFCFYSMKRVLANHINYLEPINQLSNKPNNIAIFSSIFLHFLILFLLFFSINPKISAQKIININLLSSSDFSSKNFDNKNFALKSSQHNSSVNKNNQNSVQSEPIFNAQYLNNPAPNYPLQAKARNIQGKVVLEVLVGKNGQALKVRIHSSSGSNLLDESAIETVSNWQFIPAQKLGSTVEAVVLVPIEFKIV